MSTELAAGLEAKKSSSEYQISPGSLNCTTCWFPRAMS